ncbi:Non-hemolytic phospholipase C precursor [compost metagenome]
MPQQEKGTRLACALPYQLFAECQLDAKKQHLELYFESGKGNFGQKTVPKGAPFTVYTTNVYKGINGKNWNYALTAGDQLKDQLKLEHFADNRYDIQVSGPNGFFRRFKGSKNDPSLKTSCNYESTCFLSKKPSGNIELLLENTGQNVLELEIKDNVYKSTNSKSITLAAGQKTKVVLDLKNSSGWYDFSVAVNGDQQFDRQYAGHAETGEDSITDPFMAGLL